MRRVLDLLLWSALALSCRAGELPTPTESAPSATPVAALTPDDADPPAAPEAETTTEATPGATEAFAPVPDPPRSGIYATWQSFPLHRKTNGFEGTLRLLEDSRMTRTGSTRAWDLYLLDLTLLLVRLELVADDGHVIDARELIRPVANIVVHDLRGDGHPTFFVTTDATCGMGSYCGPITELFEITGPHLQAVEAVDDTTNRFGPISLLTSLKTDWKLVPAKDGKGFEILEVKCRPSVPLFSLLLGDERPFKFVTAYSRIRFEKAAWVRRWKQRLEYRDVDDRAFDDRIWAKI